jgi:hypothetical protein
MLALEHLWAEKVSAMPVPAASNEPTPDGHRVRREGSSNRCRTHPVEREPGARKAPVGADIATARATAAAVRGASNTQVLEIRSR